MTQAQGRVAIAASVVVLSVLLAREAHASANWVGFFVTELGMLVPLGVAWWILGNRPEDFQED